MKLKDVLDDYHLELYELNTSISAVIIKMFHVGIFMLMLIKKSPVTTGLSISMV